MTTDAGFFAVMELITITGEIDIEANSISGVMEGPISRLTANTGSRGSSGADGYGERFLIEDPGGAVLCRSGRGIHSPGRGYIGDLVHVSRRQPGWERVQDGRSER